MAVLKFSGNTRPASRWYRELRAYLAANSREVSYIAM